MSTDQRHIPSPETAEACFLDGAAGEFLPEDWHAFLARVRRDAAREAVLDLAEDYRLRAEEALSDEGFNLASTLTGHFLTIRERALTEHPEGETP